MDNTSRPMRVLITGNQDITASKSLLSKVFTHIRDYNNLSISQVYEYGDSVGNFARQQAELMKIPISTLARNYDRPTLDLVDIGIVIYDRRTPSIDEFIAMMERLNKLVILQDLNDFR